MNDMGWLTIALLALLASNRCGGLGPHTSAFCSTFWKAGSPLRRVPLSLLDGFAPKRVDNPASP